MKCLNVFVSWVICVEVVVEFDIVFFVIMGNFEKLGGGKCKFVILVNVCEVIIVVIYLDGGLKFVFKFFDVYWGMWFVILIMVFFDFKIVL